MIVESLKIDLLIKKFFMVFLKFKNIYKKELIA